MPALAREHTVVGVVEAVIPGLNEELVRGRERLFFGWQFATRESQRLSSTLTSKPL